MTRVKLNLFSGSVQDKELITSFIYNDVKYVIFDGESTGSMGLPIILVGKEVLGKVSGITDAEEWKNTKECLKKIIAGESVDYASVNQELRADDIYYRQLTLPVASFDILKTSYKAPEDGPDAISVADSSAFEQITPEDISTTNVSEVSSVSADELNNVNPVSTNHATSAEVSPVIPDAAPSVEVTNVENNVSTSSSNNYESLKSEFMSAVEKLFDDIFKKIDHND